MASREPIEVTVEIPSGSRNKYEYDHVRHRYVLDRIPSPRGPVSHRLREVENFFETYKALEGRETEVSGWLGPDDAWRIIEAAVAAGQDSNRNAEPGTWR